MQRTFFSLFYLQYISPLTSESPLPSAEHCFVLFTQIYWPSLSLHVQTQLSACQWQKPRVPLVCFLCTCPEHAQSFPFFQILNFQGTASSPFSYTGFGVCLLFSLSTEFLACLWQVWTTCVCKTSHQMPALKNATPAWRERNKAQPLSSSPRKHQNPNEGSLIQ